MRTLNDVQTRAWKHLKGGVAGGLRAQALEMLVVDGFFTGWLKDVPTTQSYSTSVLEDLLASERYSTLFCKEGRDRLLAAANPPPPPPPPKLYEVVVEVRVPITSGLGGPSVGYHPETDSYNGHQMSDLVARRLQPLLGEIKTQLHRQVSTGTFQVDVARTITATGTGCEESK